MVAFHKILHHKTVNSSLEVIKLTVQTLLFIILPLVVFTFLTARTEIIKGIRSFVVVSGSMEPKIPVGSIIFTKNLQRYQIGDVIAFKNSKDQTIAHRIAAISKDGNSFTTKGDANSITDKDPVPAQKIVGKLFVLAPHVGNIMGVIKTPLGFMTIIVIPVVLFIMAELWAIKKELEKEIEKKMRAKFQEQQSLLVQ